MAGGRSTVGCVGLEGGSSSVHTNPIPHTARTISRCTRLAVHRPEHSIPALESDPASQLLPTMGVGGGGGLGVQAALGAGGPNLRAICNPNSYLLLSATPTPTPE